MVGLCLGLIKIGSCKKAKVNNDTIINKQLDAITNIVSNELSKTIASSTDSLVNLVDVEIEIEGTVIIKDWTISQFASIRSDTNMKIVDMAKSNTTINKIVNEIIDIAIKENASTGFFGGGTTIADTSIIENIKTEIRNSVSVQFTHIDKFECIHEGMNKLSLTIHHTGESGDTLQLQGFNINQTLEILSKCVIDAYIDTFNNIEISDDIQSSIDDNIVEKSEISGLSIQNAVIGIVVIIVIFFISRIMIGGITSFFKYKSSMQKIDTKSNMQKMDTISQNQINNV